MGKLLYEKRIRKPAGEPKSGRATDLHAKESWGEAHIVAGSSCARTGGGGGGGGRGFLTLQAGTKAGRNSVYVNSEVVVQTDYSSKSPKGEGLLIIKLEEKGAARRKLKMTDFFE